MRTIDAIKMVARFDGRVLRAQDDTDAKVVNSNAM